MPFIIFFTEQNELEAEKEAYSSKVVGKLSENGRRSIWKKIERASKRGLNFEFHFQGAGCRQFVAFYTMKLPKRGADNPDNSQRL